MAESHSTMMSEHLSQSQLAGYSGRTLETDELLAVDGHLASCDACHKRLPSPGVAKLALSPSLRSGEEPFHLDYDKDLEPYVDGKATEIDREIVESHVAQCSRCADELRDLLAFKQQPAVASTREEAATTSRRKQWFPQWPLLSNPAFATAAVIAVFLLAMAVLWWTTFRTAPQVEQATNGSPESDKQAVETKAPTPSATVQATTNNPPANQSHGLPTPAHEEPLITLNDAGHQILVNQRGHLEGFDHLPRDLKESVEQALATRRLRDSPALTGWPTGAGVLRSGLDQNTFTPLEPMDVVIETDRPKFRWQALEAARQYVVTIHDARYREVASSGPIVGTEWTAPNALQRGVTYSWQISALKDGKTVVSPKPPLREARFRILAQNDAVTLARLKESAGSSHLVMGVFYWKHGLLEQSEREFQALAQANPNSTAVAELLASVRALRR